MDDDLSVRLGRDRFARAWRAVGGRTDGPWTALMARWAEPHRAYHDVRHLAECLAELDLVRDLAARPAELELAIYYHDAIYDPSAADSERRSAALFRADAAADGVAAEAIDRVAALVETTAGHAVDDGDAALLADVDLAILGAGPARYAAFECDVRREYARYDDAAYGAGRARILRGFLDRAAIYRTPRVAARLEAPARTNLAAAVAALAGAVR